MTEEDNNNFSFDPDSSLTPEEFEKLTKFVSRAVKDMMRSLSSDSNDMNPKYSFNIKVDKQGIPIIERVNVQNTQPQQPPKPNPNEAVPLVDITETQKVTTVTMEMRGAEKGSIVLSVGSKQITVRSSTSSVQTAQRVALPHSVNPSSAKAHYRNGILEIKMNRSKSSPQGTVNITVE